MAANRGEVKAAPIVPAIPVSVYSCLASSSSSFSNRVTSQEPKPPPMTARPKNGPRLAPTMSEIADMITQGMTVAGSTQALWASCMGLGTFSGTFQILRRNDTMSPPRAANGIHHHWPDHQPVPVSPKKKPMPAPVIPLKRSAIRPPTPPSTSASKSKRLYHDSSRGSISVTFHSHLVNKCVAIDSPVKQGMSLATVGAGA